MTLECDAESRALYIGGREGRVEQRFDLAERGFCAFMEADGENNVLGVEFRSPKSLRVVRRAASLLIFAKQSHFSSQGPSLETPDTSTSTATGG